MERVVHKGKDHSNDITSLRSYMDSELARLEAKMNSNHEALMKELANSSFFDDLLKELERRLMDSNANMASSNKSLTHRIIKLEKLYLQHT